MENSILYDEILEKMRLHTKILSTESSLLIYFHLLLFGPRSPAELRKQLDIPKSTLFRNISYLIDVKLIHQIQDDSITDKRLQVKYVVSKHIRELINIDIPAELKKYAIMKKKKSIISNWNNMLITISNQYNGLITQLFYNQKQSSSISNNQNLILVKRLNSPDLPLNNKNIYHKMGILMFSILDGAKHPEKIEKLVELINSIQELQLPVQDDISTPKIPVALSISYFNFGENP
jgi:predicted transcriptional regulator